MLGTYSYNEIFRKTVVAFGTLFNNIELRRQDEVMKVPLAYGPKAKFLARLDQVPDPTNKRVQITLPRISLRLMVLHMMLLERYLLRKKLKLRRIQTRTKMFLCQSPII
ncbi:MAG: hypothetical protein CM15mV41_0960 [Caudoviricetes sp.]|nr:MAG: hypothetical protein CM15mV41_0960 [Caudoviricetes sp.]